MTTLVYRSLSLTARRVLVPAGFFVALAAVAACGGADSDSTTKVWPTGDPTGSGGSGGSTTGSGGSTGKGGSVGSGGTGGSTTGSGGSTGKGGGAGSGGTGGTSDGGVTPDGGTSGYTFPFLLTPLTAPSTSTSNISLYFSVTDANGVGVVGLPTMAKRPGEPKGPLDWVYREDGVELDPNESGFTASPLTGNTVDMPTVLILDLSGSIIGTTIDGGATLLDVMKGAATEIIDKMLPEQRMALMTFAGTATLRMPFSSDKVALKNSVASLSNGDGQSTNLYGAMIQAFGMWQDGFNTVGGAKLTAGLAVVLTDGEDNAGVKTLSDALAARKNKRVVAVGIQDPGTTTVNTSAMQQLASTGTFVTIDGFGKLGEQVTRITGAMATLGRSIYTANYCTPKLANTHELLFTVFGNGNTTTTSCTPATFPSTHPALCAQLDPNYTQACGYTKGPTTYTCCTATAPYTCPNDNSCYRTAADAAAKCGSAGMGGSCIMCGGSGTGASQDTGLLAGPAIRVKFDASTYRAGQCPIFWGPVCKAMQNCCAQLPSDQASTCNSQLLAALGNEATCQMLSNQYCRADGGTDGGDAGSDASTDSRVDSVRPPPPPPF